MCTTNSCCDCNNITLPTGPAGNNGTNGTNGTDGLFGGYSAEWAWSTSTASGPSSTEIRFNNATYASVTAIYLSENDINSLNVDNVITSFSNGGDYGWVRVFKEDDATIYWYGKITGVTDNGTDQTLTVTYVHHNGSFTAADNVVVSFAPKGSGSAVLHNDMAQESRSNVALGLIGAKTYTVAADTLDTNGEKLKVTVGLTKAVGDDCYFAIRANSNAILPSGITEIPFPKGTDTCQVDIVLSRKSNTALYAEVKALTTISSTMQMAYMGGFIENTASLGVLDLTGASFDIEVYGREIAGNPINCEQLTIEKYSV